MIWLLGMCQKDCSIGTMTIEKKAAAVVAVALHHAVAVHVIATSHALSA